MNTRKIATWIFFIILIVVFMFSIVTSISSVKHIVSLDNATNIVKEELTTTDNELIDSNLYEPIESPIVSDKEDTMPEQLLDDTVISHSYTIDVLNFDILLNDKRIDYKALEELYDGLKLYVTGKLTKDYTCYIEEESIIISDDTVSFKLLDANTRQEFESVTLKYVFN